MASGKFQKKISAEAMKERIDEVLYKAAVTTNGFAATTHTPLDALLAREGGDDGEVEEARHDGRKEAFGALLDYFFAEGPEPLALIRRIYAVAKAIRPHLLGDMSLEDIALLCGDGGRATVGERIKRIYNRYIEERGGGRVKAGFQKSETACGKYAAAQKGNSNRKAGAAKAAKLSKPRPIKKKK